MGRNDIPQDFKRIKMERESRFGLLAIITGGVALTSLTGIWLAPKISGNIKKWGGKRLNELDRETYMNLRKYVEEGKDRTINPSPEQGWRFYVEILAEYNPEIYEKASFNQWKTFLKTYNGGGNPQIGKPIKIPKLKYQ